jgi:hypothetical protein
MTTTMLRFLTILLGTSMLSLSAIGAEWCPKHKGSFPAAVVDLGEYKSFYFVPDSIYSEQGQTAVVYLTKNNQVFNITSAEGYSDYFTSTVYNGPANGFSCDSVTLEFESAWLTDENGQRKEFRNGEVRALYKNHVLDCSDKNEF